MNQTDVEDGYLTEKGRRRFGLQRLGLHILFWPLLVGAATSTWLTLTAQERALARAKDDLQERFEDVRLAKLRHCELKRTVLLHQEGLIQTTYMPEDQRALQLDRIGKMQKILAAETKLAEEPVRLIGEPEALTWIRNSDGSVQRLNATADGRLGAVPDLSPQALQAIAVQAVHEAEAEEAKTPRHILMRDLGEVHARVEEILAHDREVKENQNQH